MKKLFSVSLAALAGLSLLFSACSFNSSGFLSGGKGGSSEVKTYTPNTSSRNIADDEEAAHTFTNKIYIDVSSPSYSTDGSTWTALVSGSEVSTAISDVTVLYDSETEGVTVDSDSDSELQVILSGTASKRHFDFKNKKNVISGVTLNGLTITSSGNYPAIKIEKKGVVYLSAEGTNSITDGRKYGYGYGEEYSSSSSATYTDSDGNTQKCTVSANPVSDGEDTKGTIWAKGALILGGSGSLSVTEGYKHGFYSKDYIRVVDGTWNITSTGRNGIQCVNGFIMDDGAVTIKGTGSNTNNQSRGIIVEGEESTAEDDVKHPGEGFILINGGDINITTVSKAMSAKWDIDEDAETASDITDDPYPYVKITGGNITIKTTGTPADESSRTYSFKDADGVTVSEKTKLSPEGIEGKEAVFIEGGNIEVTSTDDCINANRSGYAQLQISGGKIYAYSSGNDAIDSNGALTISGGTVVALTKTNPECALDCDSYTLAITGGTVIGIGTTNYSAPTASACKQSTVVLSGNYLGSGGTTFTLGTSASNPVFAYTIDSSIFSSMSSNYIAIISSPAIAEGTSYTLYTGASVSGGTAFHNLYTEMPAVSSGTSKATGISTSSSSEVYTLSSSSNGGAQEGTHGNPQDGTQPGGMR